MARPCAVLCGMERQRRAFPGVDDDKAGALSGLGWLGSGRSTRVRRVVCRTQMVWEKEQIELAKDQVLGGDGAALASQRETALRMRSFMGEFSGL